MYWPTPNQNVHVPEYCFYFYLMVTTSYSVASNIANYLNDMNGYAKSMSELHAKVLDVYKHVELVQFTPNNYGVRFINDGSYACVCRRKTGSFMKNNDSLALFRSTSNSGITSAAFPKIEEDSETFFSFAMECFMSLYEAVSLVRTINESDHIYGNFDLFKYDEID